MRLSEIKHQLVHVNKFKKVVRTNLSEFIDVYSLDKAPGENNTHYIVSCPYCEEHDNYFKHKLYIEKELTRGFCHKCKTIYFNYTQELEFNIAQRARETKRFKLTKIPSTPGDKYSTGAYTTCYVNKEGIRNMLMERNSSRLIPLIDEIGMRGGDNFIMFPFNVDGELIYWQTKLVGFGMGWFMPPIANKPLYIPKIVSRKIVLVEGIFDALACLILFPDRTPVAVLGSYLTDYHIWMLRNYVAPTDCLIFMDNIHISIELLHQLRGRLPTITDYNLYYGKYDQDPDEFLDSMNQLALDTFIKSKEYESTFGWE